jgi:hypothetical protein
LDGSGQWTPVTTNELTQAGAAYWIYTLGASDYLAPLTVSVDLGDGLDFAAGVTELNLRLANKSTSPMNALVTEVNANGPGALAYYQFVTNSGGQWLSLSGTLLQTPAAGGASRVRLAIRRQNFGSNDYSSALEIRDGAGTRLLVPVTASGGSAETPAGPLNAAKAHAGLWIGNASINAVSEAHSANPTNPTPTKSEMNLRVLLHVDANGQTRLLKEVIQMWRDGTYTNDGSGNLVVAKPGQYVLLTDPAVESYAVTRQVQWQITSSPPSGPPVADYGFNELGGNYSEVISGLHKNPVHIAGTFRLTRVSQVADLNPSPTP